MNGPLLDIVCGPRRGAIHSKVKDMQIEFINITAYLGISSNAEHF